MATLDQFEAALELAIAPAIIKSRRGDDRGLNYTFTDGRSIVAKRTAIKEATDVASYVAELLK